MTLRNHENKCLADYRDRIPALLARFKTVTAVAAHLGFNTNTAYSYLRKHPELLPAGGLPRTKRTLVDHYASIPELLLRYGSIAKTAQHLGFNPVTLYAHLKAHPELVPPDYRLHQKEKRTLRIQVKALLVFFRNIDRTAERLGMAPTALRDLLREYPELLPPGMIVPCNTAGRIFGNERLLELLEQNIPVSRIAAIFGVRPNSVYVRINKYPEFTRFRPVKSQKVDLTTVPPERFAELLKNGTMKHAAEVLGVSPDTLCSFFYRHPERRPYRKTGSRCDGHNEKITELLKETKNVSEVARRLGFSVSALWHYLEKRPELLPPDLEIEKKRPRLDKVPPATITETLATSSNRKEAAARLGISSRTLIKYLKKHPELVPPKRRRN